MSFPEFYNPDRIGELYVPNTSASVEAGRQAQLPPAADDQTRIALLLVDMQIDFIHEDGALSVPGAIDDTRRTIEWIYTHAGQITTIAASLDSHVPIQIFSPTWWADERGHHPDPYTVISSDSVKAEQWQPLYDIEWSKEYVQRLEDGARKQLMIWPYHTLIGTAGHNIVPPLYEAIAYHTAARQSQPEFLTKGTIPKTEHYSILEPEVKVPNALHGGFNTEFLNMLSEHDQIYVAGQAKSHCVLETVTSMMRYFKQQQPDFIAKLRILEDAMSSVVHPEIDFDTIANETLQQYQQDGLNLVRTVDPIG